MHTPFVAVVSCSVLAVAVDVKQAVDWDSIAGVDAVATAAVVDAVEMHDAAEDVTDVENADAAGVDDPDVDLHGVDEEVAVGGAVDVVAAAVVAAVAVVVVVDAAADVDVDVVVDDVADGVVAVDDADAVFVAVEVGKLEDSVAVSNTAILAVVEKTPHCCNYHIVDL